LNNKKYILPLFLLRGYNYPFNEGYIVVTKNIIEGLYKYHNINSIIFNYKYQLINNKSKNNFKKHKYNQVIYNQVIPMFSREHVFHNSDKFTILLSSLMESIFFPKFLCIEKKLQNIIKYYNTINIVNSFKLPRILFKDYLKSPIILHIYSRSITSKRLLNFIVKYIDAIIVSSKSLFNYFFKEYNIPKSVLNIVYPPIKTTFYKPFNKEIAKSFLDINQKIKIISYIGNLRQKRFPEKFVLPLIKNLVNVYPNLLLLIYAPVNTENYIRIKYIMKTINVLKLKKNVKIIMYNLSEKEKLLIYNYSDIFIYPSLEEKVAIEPPLTILEAMSCGTPVACFDLDYSHEVIDNTHDGIILKKEDGSKNINKLIDFFQNKEAQIIMSSNARKKILNSFSEENSINNFLKVNKKVHLV